MPVAPSPGSAPPPGAPPRLGDREKLMSLLEISKAMSAETGLDALLDVIMRETTRALHAERSTLFLLAPGGDDLWSRIALGLEPREIRLKAGEGIAGFVASTGRPVNIPDAYADPRFSPEVDRQTGYRTRTVMAAPVRTSAGMLLGVLEVLNKVGGPFNAEDEAILGALASQAAVAVHNAQLYDDLRRANAELKQLDQMKFNFLATISHELRTPLAPILGYLHLFLSATEAPGPLAERQRAGLEVMLHSAHRLQDLVEDLLTFVQLERGDLDLNRQRASLEPLLRQQAAGAAAAAAEKGIDLRVEIREPVPAVLVDARVLGRAVRLILDNAVKFTPAGGRITLSAGAAGDGLDGVRGAWADPGNGFPEDEVVRIFDSFYQVDGSTTRQFGGTGLGLALVKRIIEAHGASMSVESRVGAGSVFAFVLPAA